MHLYMKICTYQRKRLYIHGHTGLSRRWLNKSYYSFPCNFLRNFLRNLAV